MCVCVSHGVVNKELTAIISRVSAAVVIDYLLLDEKQIRGPNLYIELGERA